MDKFITLPKSEKVFKINCKSNTEAEIVIYDDIGKDGFFFDAFSAKDLDAELKKPEMKNVTDLTVRINSGGGSVFEGYTIYNRLKRHRAKVTVYVDGMAASIASIIALAGDEVIMGEASALMIHKPWAPMQGNATEMNDMAELLDSLENQMVAVYKKRTGKDEVEIRQMLAEETWFFGQEAVDHGFATRMDEGGELMNVAASADKKWFKHKPKMEAQNLVTNKINSFKDELENFLAR